MTTTTIKLSKGQLEAAIRLLKGERMCSSKSMGFHYLPATGGSSFTAPRFAKGTLDAMQEKNLVVLGKDWFGSKDYVLNEERRAELEAYMALDSVKAQLRKLTTAQMFVVDRMKKGWALYQEDHADGYMLQEPVPQYGRRMMEPIARATVHSLQGIGVLTEGEKIEKRQFFKLNLDVLTQDPA